MVQNYYLTEKMELQVFYFILAMAFCLHVFVFENLFRGLLWYMMYQGVLGEKNFHEFLFIFIFHKSHILDLSIPHLDYTS